MRPPFRSHRLRTPSAVGLDLWSPGAQPGFVHGDLRVLPGFWADPGVYMPWAGTPGDPRHQASTAPRVLPSARPKTSAPRLSLSRLVTTACTLAVYASQRRVTPTLRKTRFRWVANPCRVGLEPTGSAAKGFRFCLLHMPFSLPRLGLARGTSPRSRCPPRQVRSAGRHNPFKRFLFCGFRFRSDSGLWRLLRRTLRSPSKRRPAVPVACERISWTGWDVSTEPFT